MPSRLPSFRFKPFRASIALAGLGLWLSGCRSWLDGFQSTLSVDGPVARSQRDLFYTTCYVTFAIFLVVGGVLAYATIRFKDRDRAGAEPPPQSHGNPLIEIGLIAASVLLLAVIAIPTLRAIWFTYDIPVAEKGRAYEITATGYQWWWKFEYPGALVKLAPTGEMPLATANELVIPAGRPVHIDLRTTDVIHSFWVPKLAGKVDMIPNRANHIWLQADQPGYFYGQCAQFCGDSHAVMRFRVIALGEKEFAEWLAQQTQPATQSARSVAAAAPPADQPRAILASFKRNQFGFGPEWESGAPIPQLDLWRAQQSPGQDEDPALIARGRALFQAKTCISCHTVRGHEGVGITGPDLTHVGARTTIAAGSLENTPEQLARWIRHPDQVKPGNKMYTTGYVPNQITLGPEEVTALVAYLRSLK
jgi:cytochrome c oxidase subunit 2